jgi:hypothetical protein
MHPREPRTKAPPKRFEDFEVQIPPSVDRKRTTTHQSSLTVHPFAHYISYDKFTDSHKAYLAAISSHNEPKNFKEAMQDRRWVDAMKKEI